MAKVYVFFADGVEEIEGLTAVDILRRGGQDVVTVSVTGEWMIEGSHGIRFTVDRLFENEYAVDGSLPGGNLTDGDMVVLPGGGKGTQALLAHEGLAKLLLSYAAEGKWIGAICAAPSVLGKYGLLQGKRATCFPGFEEKLLGATVTGEAVTVDGNIITGKGMGVSGEFAVELLRALNPAEADRVAKTIQMR
ncbi:MAG: DJ-1/PfpI family protein [Lachnospiraceae bacterium]|jgi:4-methyl-5(b-hydroxyethyl)-thiazole monophosphate biosynthesis|nr:DJ-1/PfpI family protein [Lachnospiraceae bacterium]MCR5375275.1 DJ-1/PfpI family protein [Lachnospiraceae bacterium]